MRLFMRCEVDDIDRVGTGTQTYTGTLAIEFVRPLDPQIALKIEELKTKIGELLSGSDIDIKKGLGFVGNLIYYRGLSFENTRSLVECGLDASITYTENNVPNCLQQLDDVIQSIDGVMEARQQHTI